MKRITISPEDLRVKIEDHFNNNGLKAELYISASAQAGPEIQSVRLRGVFNASRILEVDIYFNGKYEPVLTDFKGICPIEELATILIEMKKAIDNV